MTTSEAQTERDIFRTAATSLGWVAGEQAPWGD